MSLPARAASRLAVRLAAVAASMLAVVAYTGGTTSVDAAPMWAPAATATIHPGTQMFTKGAQCTANFVYTDGAGTVYVGYAAHCAGTGSSTDTNGCTTKSLPLGTKVTFNKGANLASEGTVVGKGTLAYSSWLAMQKAGETGANTCAYNDLALVKVDPASVKNVNPSVPFWGGPTALHSGGTAAGDQVFSFGNSLLRGGVEQLGPKTGLSVGDAGNGWSHNVYTMTPGIPGDSGSGFMDAKGNALGVLSTLQIAPLVGSNGVGDLAKEVAYARGHGVAGLTVTPGTVAFNPVL
ncbi:MAG: hypothetical protein ACRDP1_03525 [Nocardioidaceae bacterium]